jgi:DNA integrity scanning protein DisA with diadenylate cyclase activity
VKLGALFVFGSREQCENKANIVSYRSETLEKIDAKQSETQLENWFFVFA